MEEVDFKGPLGDFFEKMVTKVWLFEVVKPLNMGGETSVCGTGICIDLAGLVLSPYHLFPKSGSRIYARRYKGELTCNLVAIAIKPEWNLMLMKISRRDYEEEFDYVKMTENGDLKTGKDLACIGHPDHLAFSMTIGYIVSECPPCDYNPREDYEIIKGKVNCRSIFELLSGALIEDHDKETRVSLFGYEDPLAFIQVAIKLGPGASGAPLFDELGRLVGMNLYNAGSYGYAIHVGFIREFVKSFLGRFKDHAKKPIQKSTRSGGNKRSCDWLE